MNRKEVKITSVDFYPLSLYILYRYSYDLVAGIYWDIFLKIECQRLDGWLNWVRLISQKESLSKKKSLSLFINKSQDEFIVPTGTYELSSKIKSVLLFDTNVY